MAEYLQKLENKSPRGKARGITERDPPKNIRSKLRDSPHSAKVG